MKRQLLSLAGAAAAALFAGNAIAADAAAPLAPLVPAAQTAPAAKATDAKATDIVPAAKAASAVVRGEELSSKQMLQRSQESIGTMRQTLKAILTKLEEARAANDVVKVNCVNDKLTNIKGLLRISEQADVALQEAVAKSEEQAASHEFSKITIARQKVDQMRAEAEQCVGMLAFEAGETKVSVDEPQDLPTTDPTQAPPLPPVVTRPPPASPTN